MTTSSKVCFKCRQEKPLEDFYRHSMMADGHLNKCAVCTRRDVQQNYAAKRERYRHYDRLRYENGHRPPPRAKEKNSATQAVYRAVKNGLLVRQPCEVCRAEQVQAHHDDYSMPLKVRWLCRVHHGMAHRKEKTA